MLFNRMKSIKLLPRSGKGRNGIVITSENYYGEIVAKLNEEGKKSKRNKRKKKSGD